MSSPTPGSAAGTGFAVVIRELSAYSAKLAGKQAIATEISSLVNQSDVANDSWGVVGIFVKKNYTDLLGDLVETLGHMADGLQSSSDKFSRAANAYAQHENDTKTALEEALKALDGQKP